MTSTNTVDGATAAAPTTVVAAALVGALGSAAYISSLFFLSDMSNREAVSSPFTVTVNAVTTLAFIALALHLPGIASHSRLPRWALLVTAFACAFVAALTWALGTIGAAAAASMTDTQFEDTNSFTFWLAYLPKMLLSAVGLVGLAVAGWRQRTIARGACLLLGVAGVASILPPHPPGALLAGIALAWAVRSAASPAPGLSR